MQRLVISVTIALPDDALASSKLQTAALEAGDAFKKAVAVLDKKAAYEARVVRARAEDAPKIVRKKAEASVVASVPAAEITDQD